MIPLAAIQRIAKKAGAGRISGKALKELQRTVEEMGLDLAREAAVAAAYAGRKTIKGKDIRLVAGKH